MAKTEFRFELDGIDLNDAAKQRIQKGIQSLVLEEVAGITKADKATRAATLSGIGFHIPNGWWGGRLVGNLPIPIAK